MGKEKKLASEQDLISDVRGMCQILLKHGVRSVMKL